MKTRIGRLTMAAVPGTLREEIFSMVLEVVSVIMLPADAPGIIVYKKYIYTYMIDLTLITIFKKEVEEKPKRLIQSK